MRKALDQLYEGALMASILAMLAIAGLVLVQVTGRVLDRALGAVGATPLGITVPSLAEIGGFLFVASAFLALPATMRAAAHVRVTMLAGALPARAAHALTVIVLAIATTLAGFAAWHAVLQALDSWQFNSLSFGMIRIPLWIPQGTMAVGLVIFTVALIDDLILALKGEDPVFLRAEKAKSSDATGGH